MQTAPPMQATPPVSPGALVQMLNGRSSRSCYDMEEVGRLLHEHGPEGAAQLVRATDEHGRTALMVAGTIRFYKGMEVLLKHIPEEQVCAISFSSLTALMYAARSAESLCIKVLLEHIPEQQVLAVDSSGRNALMHFLVGSRWWSRIPEPLVALLQHRPEDQVLSADVRGLIALMVAADSGHAGQVKLLLGHAPEAQVMVACDNGETALMFAVYRGHAECVKELLQHAPEAQVMAARNNGHTALVMAARGRHAECVELLLRHYSNEMQPQVDAAFSAAKSQSHVECVRLLVRYASKACVRAAKEELEMNPELYLSPRAKECVLLMMAALAGWDGCPL